MADGIQAEALFRPEDLARLDGAGPLDLLVGVPALNHARSVAHVVEGVASGLAKYFPGQRGLVLVADAGSRDGTLEVVRAWRETAPSVRGVLDVRLAGPPHWGSALLAVFLAGRRLGARAFGLAAADLTSVEPAWVDRLLQPVFQGEAEYVSPAYMRAVSEGTLTTNLLAPLMRALYGKRIQQVMGGCAGMSGDLAGRLLRADTRKGDLLAHGVELWLTTEALASGARVMEAHLGRKAAAPGTGQPDLATTVSRVVGALFSLMEKYHPVWNDISGSAPLPLAGNAAAFVPEPGEVPVERMVRAFRLGLKDLLPVWEQIMPEETLVRLYPLGLLAVDEFQLPPPVWARVVSDFALAYHERRLPRDHLLRALTPLYLGRVAAFLVEARGTPLPRRPDILEAIGQAFEAEKESLRARWR